MDSKKALIKDSIEGEKKEEVLWGRNCTICIPTMQLHTWGRIQSEDCLSLDPINVKIASRTVEHSD
eukprot:scaffold287362_cov17-Tisochrysis_lutea.AAC.1